MSAADALFETAIPELPMIARGKVRDIYRIDEDRLLIVDHQDRQLAPCGAPDRARHHHE